MLGCERRTVRQWYRPNNDADEERRGEEDPGIKRIGLILHVLVMGRWCYWWP